MSLYIDIKKNVECEMCDNIGNICSNRNSNKDLKKTLELITRTRSIDSIDLLLVQNTAVLRTSHII